MRERGIVIVVVLLACLVQIWATPADAVTPYPCTAVREAQEKLPELEQAFRDAKRTANKGIRLLDDFINDPTFEKLGPNVRRRLLEYRQALEQNDIDAARAVNQCIKLSNAYVEALNEHCGGV